MPLVEITVWATAVALETTVVLEITITVWEITPALAILVVSATIMEPMALVETTVALEAITTEAITVVEWDSPSEVITDPVASEGIMGTTVVLEEIVALVEIAASVEIMETEVELDEGEVV